VKKCFAQLDDYGHTFVKPNSVIAVTYRKAYDNISTYIYLEGGNRIEMENLTIEQAFERLAAARENYGHEQCIVSMACQLVDVENEMNECADTSRVDSLLGSRAMMLRNLVRAVNAYRGVK